MKHPPTLTHLFKTTAWLLATTLCTAHAMSLRELQALSQAEPQGENYANYYLAGVMEGAMEAHLKDARHGARPTLCLSGRAPPPTMARRLLDAELQRHPDVYEADMPVQLALTNALAASYPCK